MSFGCTIYTLYTDLYHFTYSSHVFDSVISFTITQTVMGKDWVLTIFKQKLAQCLLMFNKVLLNGNHYA